MAGAGAAALLALTACGPSDESISEDITEEIDDGLLTEAHVQVARDPISVSSVSLRADIVEGADPQAVGRHAEELYAGEDLHHIALDQEGEGSVPTLSVRADAEMEGVDWGPAVELFLEAEPRHASLFRTDAGEPRMSLSLQPTGDDLPRHLERYRGWQDLEVPEGFDGLTLRFRGTIWAVGGGSESDAEHETRVSLNISAPPGEGEAGLDLFDRLVDEIGDSEALQDISHFYWSSDGDSGQMEIQVGAEDPSSSEVVEEAEVLADLIEGHLGEQDSLSITESSSGEKLVQRGTEEAPASE